VEHSPCNFLPFVRTQKTNRTPAIFGSIWLVGLSLGTGADTGSSNAQFDRVRMGAFQRKTVSSARKLYETNDRGRSGATTTSARAAAVELACFKLSAVVVR